MCDNYDPNKCQTVSEMLARLGDKWTVLVIMMLGDGPQRFSDLKRSVVGISQRMLTLTLRALERDGIVERTVHPTVPPKVEYSLTDEGRTIGPILLQLRGWGHGWLRRRGLTTLADDVETNAADTGRFADGPGAPDMASAA